MPAATILFMDIVEFSEQSTAEQLVLIESLTERVKNTLASVLAEPPNILFMPTGDGMAVAFLHGKNAEWIRTPLLGLIFSLQDWARVERKVHGAGDLRIGVHSGDVEYITDINTMQNICGDTINMAARVMGAANPKQVLFSDAAFRGRMGRANLTYTTPPYSDELKAVFKGPYDVHVKHGVRLNVYKMDIDPVQEWWSNEEPASKYRTTATLTPLPKEIVGAFGERIKHGRMIAFILLTGERFLNNYDAGTIELQPALESFSVFMPDPDAYEHLHRTQARATAGFIRECIERWKQTFAVIHDRCPKATLKLGLYKEPPFLGASFIDWEFVGGRIHISPYVWDIPAKDCPGYELEWTGKRPSPVYKTYVKGLQYLDTHIENRLD